MAESSKVLFVSEDKTSARDTATALEAEYDRYTVTTESSVSEGIDLVRTGAFDCVVSEYELPDRDGIEFLETIRRRDEDLPFVLYTDEGDEDVAAAAISADVTAYLQKDDLADQQTALARTIEDALEDTPDRVRTDRHRLEQILKTVPGCVVQLNRDGHFIYANEHAQEVLGLEQTAVTGRTYNDPEWEIRDLEGEPIPDDELPFRQVLDSGEPIHGYQHSIQWPDGSEKILSVSGAPLFDNDGTVDSVVFSLTDITDQKQREQELDRYQQIVEHLDDIATIIAPDGTIRYVSPAVERVLGYEPSELIGENGFGYQPPETSQAVAEAVESAIDDPTQPHTVQTKFRRADGSWCWIESTLRNRLDDDVIDGILVSSRDVTDRLEQKQRTQQREEQLGRLHEATRELLQSETSQEVAKTASRTAVDILDFPLNGIHFYDETSGGLEPTAVSDAARELFDEVPVIDEGIAWKAFQSGEPQIHHDLDDATNVFNGESPIQSEIHLPLIDTGVFMISSTEANAFTETDIEFARVLAANTEAALNRIGKEQQLRNREAELEQQNERLEEFAGIVSHDLRNPLNVAQARTELLTDGSESEHLRSIERSLDRMDEIISDTLTLAREGDVVAETELIQLTDLVEKCWQTVSTDEAVIEVTDDVRFYGDEGRLQHLFENLFRNSVEHSSTSSRPRADDSVEYGGSEVVVRVGRFGDDGIYVEDTGPGIPESERQAVFDPGHTTVTDGTGFGLTIVKRIIEAHGWEVAVVDGTDGGARFEITGIEMDDR